MLPYGTTSDPADDLVTLQYASRTRGVSERTLRRRIADGSLPAYRFGPRLLRVKLADLDQLMQRVPTTGN